MSDSNQKTRELPPWARITVLVGAGILILIVLALAFRPGAVEVDLALVERGVMEVSVEEDGKARLQDRYVISSPVAGTLTRVQWRAGDMVEAGDEITRIQSMPAPLLDRRSRAQAEAALEGARAGLEQARAREEAMEGAQVEAREELRRQQVLLREGGGSTSAVERAEANLRSREAEYRSAAFAVRAAEQEVENARLLLELGGEEVTALPVTSPVQGRVLRVMQESEVALQAGTPILEVGDLENLELVVDLLSADAVRVRPGARAQVERWGGEPALAARVRTVEPSAFTRVSALGIEEQRVNVILDLEEPREEWELLGDGYRVEARIVVWEEDDVLKAPASAVFRQDDEWFTYRVDGGRAHLTPVELGQRSDVEVQVLSGLEEGDQVILYPGERIEGGTRVQRR
jgi:HlyD family secretion protein